MDCRNCSDSLICRFLLLLLEKVNYSIGYFVSNQVTVGLVFKILHFCNLCGKEGSSALGVNNLVFITLLSSLAAGLQLTNSIYCWACLMQLEEQ